jgi:pimeloyl-ACP methyl ester carboxylesterase
MEIVFVHGALVRDGNWWWKPTADLLIERVDIRSRSVALPSCRETIADDAGKGLTEDALALRAELDKGDSVIVVSHSYGGTVIAEAGHHPAIANLLYVSSYLPDIGLAQGAIMSGEKGPASIGDNGDGTLSLTGYGPRSFGERFLQDSNDETQRQAWARRTSQSVSAFTTPTTEAGWEGVDSTYIVCGEDRSTSLDLQRAQSSSLGCQTFRSSKNESTAAKRSSRYGSRSGGSASANSAGESGAPGKRRMDFSTTSSEEPNPHSSRATEHSHVAKASLPKVSAISHPTHRRPSSTTLNLQSS